MGSSGAFPGFVPSKASMVRVNASIFSNIHSCNNKRSQAASPNVRFSFTFVRYWIKDTWFGKARPYSRMTSSNKEAKIRAASIGSSTLIPDEGISFNCRNWSSKTFGFVFSKSLTYSNRSPSGSSERPVIINCPNRYAFLSSFNQTENKGSGDSLSISSYSRSIISRNSSGTHGCSPCVPSWK